MSSNHLEPTQIDVNKIIQKYREALAEAQQNVIVLSAQVEQLQETLAAARTSIPST